ncbi:hypothetical protein LZ30DRAFT_726285, partial [Colletotrichum cereale]
MYTLSVPVNRSASCQKKKSPSPPFSNSRPASPSCARAHLPSTAAPYLFARPFRTGPSPIGARPGQTRPEEQERKRREGRIPNV